MLAAKANPGLSAAKKEKNDAKRDNRLVPSARRAARHTEALGGGGGCGARRLLPWRAARFRSAH